MILYHGTKAEYGEMIVKSGILKNDVKRNYECNDYADLGTTNGYVYLTDKLYVAASYGNKNTFLFVDEGQKRDDFFYIFRIDMPSEMVEADLDEIKIVARQNTDREFSVEESLNLCSAVRCSTSISKNHYRISYTICPNTLNHDVPYTDLELVRQFVPLSQTVIKPELSKQEINKIKELTRIFNERFEWCKL